MTITRPGSPQVHLWHYTRMQVYEHVNPEVSRPVQASVIARVAMPIFRRTRQPGGGLTETNSS